jgi:6-pyruvoyltetrahydropterin/6-carboxytetrahydropterin synthase
LDTDAFKNLNPTAENIARVIYDFLRPNISASLELKIRLYETERNFVDYPA